MSIRDRNPYPRKYIERLRRDPRLRAMRDGWVAQATIEAENTYPDPRDGRPSARWAAERAIDLAMQHVLDNDGEMHAVMAERDQFRDQSILDTKLTPLRLVIEKEAK